MTSRMSQSTNSSLLLAIINHAELARVYAVPSAVLLHICDRQLAPAVARNRCWGLSEAELASESRSRPLTIHIDLLLVAIACTSFLPLAFACHHPWQFLLFCAAVSSAREREMVRSSARFALASITFYCNSIN